MSALPGDVLPVLFGSLTSRNGDIREQAAVEIRDYVASYSEDHPQDDALNALWNDLNRRVFSLIHSNQSFEIRGGITAIDRLLETKKDVAPEKHMQRVLRFYHYLKPLLPCADAEVMVQASKVLGRIAKITQGEGFFDFEVDRALEMMRGGGQEIGRYAAVLILYQLSSNAPAVFMRCVVSVLDMIWTPLKDHRTVVRERTSMLLGSCFELIHTRELDFKVEQYKKILDEAERTLNKPAPSQDVIHGGLLALQSLLNHSEMFMKEYYKPSCELILKYKDHREPLIRRTVITLIPAMGTYDQIAFQELFLHRSMAHLQSQLSKPGERDAAFLAIGHLAVNLGSEMKPFIEEIMKNVKDALRQKGKKNSPDEKPIFQCVAMLATALGPSLTRHMHEVLDLMFQWGLTEQLRMALVAIARHIPPLLRSIQDRLLDMLSTTLTGRPYRPLGAPPPRLNGTTNHNVTINELNYSPQLISLALYTLSSFDFSGHVLNEFVQHAALPYLENDSPEVRQTAALTCSKLFVRDPICHQTSTHSIEIISDVLDKLLTVAIADPDSRIRLSVLQSLDEKFDRHLAQAENVRSLFIALNDEMFKNREVAIGIIGRLAAHNPAYVMPSLRKSLIQLITELEYSTASKQKEESAKLLCLLIEASSGASSTLVKPYAGPLLSVLLRTASAKDTNPAVASYCLACLGELARVGGEEISPSVDKIMALIMEMLSDQTSSLKRDAALKTLGQVASNTGAVIEPYQKYPHLLGMLMRFLKTEKSQNIRRETIRTMGMLGALDPYRHKLLHDESDDQDAEASGARVTDVQLLMNAPPTAPDEFYQTVTINALVNVLADPTLTNNHWSATEAVMLIFTTQGLKCVPYLGQIIPAFLGVVRLAPPSLQETYFHQLALLVGIVKAHIRNYLGVLFDLIHDFWNPDSTLQFSITSLVESIAVAVEGQFKAFLPKLLQELLRTFEGDISAGKLSDRRKQNLLRMIKAFYVFGASVEEYMHLILPVIVKCFERTDAPFELRSTAIQTIGHLCRKVNLSDNISQIIHPLARVLAGDEPDLKVTAMDSLCAIVLQLGPDYAIFIPMINKVLLTQKVTHPLYDSLIQKLLNREVLPLDIGLPDPSLDLAAIATVAQEQNRMVVNQQHLKGVWNTDGIGAATDWKAWLKRLGLELMRQSPSHALRSCHGLAEVHSPFGQELFNVAFISCWTELYEQYREDLVKHIELAITSPTVPSEVVITLLTLAEFMEHDEKPLPIDPKMLGDYAMVYHAYAKALHYKEIEFFAETTGPIIEDLISVNTKLQQTDAAWGTLNLAQETTLSSQHQEAWFEKLSRWDKALELYNAKEIADQNNKDPDPDVILGKLRCLHALGQWENLSDFVQSRWTNAPYEERRRIAPIAAAAAWSLNQWDLMDDYISVMKTDTPDRPFYRAILSVHRNQYAKALTQITRTRDLLDGELTSLSSESYGRAYDVVVRVQMLSELEEIIAYKQWNDQPARQAVQRKVWMKRLKGCQPDVEVWQRILQVRTLVLSPVEATDMWIKFVNLCRKSDRLDLAAKTLNSLLGSSSLGTDVEGGRAPPNILYAYYKFTWAKGDRLESLDWLRDFTANLVRDVNLTQVNGRLVAAHPSNAAYTELLARCHVKLGEWQVALQDDWVANNPTEILSNYAYATQLDPDWYKGWHIWALANFEVITHLELQKTVLAADAFNIYIKPAVQAFFRSIALSRGDWLQDTLRLLTLWFTYGYEQGVNDAISEGFKTVNINVWLNVLPQIIARLHNPREKVRRLIQELLLVVGKAHPQALIYPLTVASKSSVGIRRDNALQIMTKMRDHSATLVDQATLVSTELIRTAILWHEQWQEGLEEASKHYFGDHNPEGMFAVLEPLHEMVAKGPETLRETSFVQSFGHDLQAAREHCRRFRMSGEVSELNQAWDIYYLVFKRLSKQLATLPSIELQYVSPKLLKVRDLDLAIPGTYLPGKPVVTISYVLPTFAVIGSKQRPRRFSMKGSDGKEYQYLLKGHEDLRQDERVMQLFGLVNTLLSVDPESFKRHLHIQQFAVIPLSSNSGLIGWVPHSDTLHVLIKDYRDNRKILLNIEHRLMTQMAPDYDHLPLVHKVEVFEHALDNTTGQDLYRVLWLKSKNSESWLERRTTYTRSLATNSMVGYILGLGDRHPSNLMLDQISGKVIHIDFGDCFEVAMQREKFPEKIPFRLTRMLVNAMEVSGIHGSYKKSCEVTMDVLRDNKDSLMAVLEAFVYDPLITWRLIANTTKDTEREPDAIQDGRGYPGQRKTKTDEAQIIDGENPELKNPKALNVIDRVRNKLTGRDFKPTVVLPVQEQVQLLIAQATSLENLCQCFIGWCAFW